MPHCIDMVTCVYIQIKNKAQILCTVYLLDLSNSIQ